MMNKDYSDDDNPQPLAPEERPRVAARAPIGRDFLDDDVLPSRSDPALRSRHVPLGRDFLDRDLQQASSEGLSRNPAHVAPRFGAADNVLPGPETPIIETVAPLSERRPAERSYRSDDDMEARLSVSRPAARATERIAETISTEPEGQGAQVASRSSATAGARTRRASPPPPADNNTPSGNPPSPSGKRPIVAVVSAVVAVCALGAIGSWLWQSGMLGSKPAVSQAEPIKNAFYDQIQQAGAKSCSRVFPALGQMVTLGSSYALQSSWNQDAPGSHSIFAVSGLAYDRPDFKGSGAALVFASPVGTRCEGAAMRVLTLPMACSEVSASRLPAGATRSGDLSDVPLYELANGAGKLMLVPATETACTVVTVMLAED